MYNTNKLVTNRGYSAEATMGIRKLLGVAALEGVVLCFLTLTPLTSAGQKQHSVCGRNGRLIDHWHDKLYCSSVDPGSPTDAGRSRFYLILPNGQRIDLAKAEASPSLLEKVDAFFHRRHLPKPEMMPVPREGKIDPQGRLSFTDHDTGKHCTFYLSEDGTSLFYVECEDYDGGYGRPTQKASLPAARTTLTYTATKSTQP